MTATGQPRVQKGVPTGGEYAATVHAEPDIELDDWDEDDGDSTVFAFIGPGGEAYEVDDVGDGTYTVFSDCEKVVSFAYSGDPDAHDEIEEKAVEAIEMNRGAR